MGGSVTTGPCGAIGVRAVLTGKCGVNGAGAVMIGPCGAIGVRAVLTGKCGVNGAGAVTIGPCGAMGEMLTRCDGATGGRTAARGGALGRPANSGLAAVIMVAKTARWMVV
jgi:hypothetical protein